MDNPFMQEWVETPEERARHAIAREYYLRAEAYDRTVCTGPMGRDGILPGSDWEGVLINRHAIALRKELMDRTGMSYREFICALQAYDRSGQWARDQFEIGQTPGKEKGADDSSSSTP